MKIKLYSFLLFCILIFSHAQAQERTTTLSDLSWLAGCWDGSTKESEAMEQWMKPAGQTMLGMSRTIAGGKTVAYEYMQLQEKDGQIYFVALPSGQKETSFQLIRYQDQEAVFENKEHDFPQRVIYKLEKDGSLAAAIEGNSKGKLKRIDFPMKRTNCN